MVAHSPELGGDIVRIRAGPDEDDAGFLSAVGVPTFAARPSGDGAAATSAAPRPNHRGARRRGLEGALGNANAFLVEDAVRPEVCEAILRVCEEELEFGDFDAGKNRHGALQVVVTEEVANELLGAIGPHVDPEAIAEAARELGEGEGDGNGDGAPRSFALAGVNRRWRVYRYAPDRRERFAPHIDAGFPPGGVSWDDDERVAPASSRGGGGSPFLHWDASHQHPAASEIVSRLTVLLYLNEDFQGGRTRFYSPVAEREDGDADGEVVAAIRPRAGSILVFPQAVSEAAVERAHCLW